MADPKSQAIAVLSSEEAAQLVAINAELTRMVMIHEALTEKRLSTMRSIVLSRGESLEDNFTIDAEKGLLIKHAPEPTDGPVAPVDANGSAKSKRRPRPTVVKG